MQVSDNIIFCLQNEEDCKSYLETLKGIIADIERFALLYNYAIKNDSPHRKYLIANLAHVIVSSAD